MGFTVYSYRRLWLFGVPRQLGAYYCIRAYIITIITAWFIKRMRFKSNASNRACVRSDDRNTKQIAMAQATLEGLSVQENPTRKS